MAVMVEDGVQLSDDIIRQLHIPLASRKNNVTVLNHLYSKLVQNFAYNLHIFASELLLPINVKSVMFNVHIQSNLL